MPAPALRLLGASSAAGLLGVDLVYLARRRLPRIYAMDALAEATFVLAWLMAG